MWSASETEHGAGGFLDSTYNGDTTTTQTTKPDTVRGNAIVPVMIGHLLSGPVDSLTLWGSQVKFVSVVAYVRHVERVTTKISYEIADETGPIMAFQWIDENDPRSGTTIPVGSYARFVGSPRDQSNVPHIFILKIFPINKMVDVFEHLLEVTYVCFKGKDLYAKKDSQQPMQIKSDDNNDTVSNMSKEQAIVFRMIESTGDTETGIERSVLKKQLQPNMREKLDKILEFLICEGHIYTTCTDDHFKAT